MPDPLIYKNKVLKQFQTIPSVGKACALDLWNIGLRDISDLHSYRFETLPFVVQSYNSKTELEDFSM